MRMCRSTPVTPNAQGGHRRSRSPASMQSAVVEAWRRGRAPCRTCSRGNHCRGPADTDGRDPTSLVKVWRAWRRVGDDPDPYVYRVLVNTHAAWWRRRWRGEIPTAWPPEIGEHDKAIEAADSRAFLLAALGRLPPRQRAVLVLRFFVDLSEPQVAEILGCSVGTVKSQASKVDRRRPREDRRAAAGVYGHAPHRRSAVHGHQPAGAPRFHPHRALHPRSSSAAARASSWSSGGGPPRGGAVPAQEWPAAPRYSQCRCSRSPHTAHTLLPLGRIA
jgi:RNA polymerase sigma-70 factor (sigma-E family)